MSPIISRSWLLATVASIAHVSAAHAESTYQFNLPSEPLSEAVRTLGRQTGSNILIDSDVGSVITQPLKGEMTVAEALKRLTAGRDMAVQSVGDHSFSIGHVRLALTNTSTLQGAGPSAQQVIAGQPQVSAILMASAQQGAAQAPDTVQENPSSDQSAPPVQTVTVTGTRIIRNGYSAPTPVTVAPVAELQQTTPSDIADALNKLPEFSGSITPTSNNNSLNPAGNFLNLRDLGPDRTLVLLDGQRVPPTSFNGTVDVNTLPQLLVQRVDIVTGGASAVYGSDAVAGVVNYVLDTRFTGFKGIAQTGISTYGDVPSQKLGFAVGAPVFGAGHFVFSYEHHSEAGLNQNDRGFTSDYPVYTGTGTAADPYTLTYNNRLSGTAFGGLITKGPSSIVGQQFVGSGTLASFNPGTPTGSSTASVGGSGAYYSGMQLLKPEDTDQLFGRFDYDIGHGISAFAQIDGALSQSNYVSNSTVLNTTIYSGNPFLPANVQAALGPTGTFNMSSLLQNLALQSQIIEKTQSVTGSFGLQGKVLNDVFSWNASYEHGEGLTHSETTNNINTSNLYAALDAVTGPNGAPVCRVSTTSYASLYPGCVPLDIFGVGNESAAALDYIYQNTWWSVLNKMDDVTASISGSAFNDWAGPVSVASNFEYRSQSMSVTSNTNPAAAPTLTGLRTTWSGNTPNSPYLYGIVAPQGGANSVWEVSGETVVPLLKDRFLVDNLEVNGAARYTDYSTSGPVTTWKMGFNYQPIRDLRLRVTESRDIRAPNLYELYQAPSTLTIQTYDPHTGTTGAVKIESVGNTNLQPEVAITKTVGAVYSPSWFSGFKISVDYYRIDLKDVIGTLTEGEANPSTALDACQASGGTSILCQAIIRPLPYSNTTSANFPTLIYNENFNLAQSETDGIDVETSYNFIPRNIHINIPGHADIRVLYSYVPDQITIAGPGSAPVNAAGTSVSIDRLTAMLNYIVGQLSASWQTTYQGPRHLGTGAQGQVFAGPGLPALITDDLSLAYRFEEAGQKLQAFLTINNIFNQSPLIAPTVQSSPSPGLQNPTSGDVIGRYFTVGLRMGF